jgi:hypothetical protein
VGKIGVEQATKKNAPGYLEIREEQLGSLIGVED